MERKATCRAQINAGAWPLVNTKKWEEDFTGNNKNHASAGDIQRPEVMGQAERCKTQIFLLKFK